LMRVFLVIRPRLLYIKLMKAMFLGQHRAFLSFAVLLAAAVNAGAAETAWFTGLVTAVDRERSLGSALDASTIAPYSKQPIWSAAISAPYAYDPSSSSGQLTADPYAIFQLSNPEGSINTWALGAGIASSLSQDTPSDPYYVYLGGMISAEADVYFSGRTGFVGSPSERLRAIELEGKLRDNERIAGARLLNAADLAARSAAADGEADYAASKAAYLEKKARRVEIDFNEGRVSRADFMEAKDAFTKAKMDAESYRHLADSLGRQARMAARLPLPGDGSVSFAFKAADLFALATVLAPIFDKADPVTTAVAAATAPWERRIAELSVEALTDAPHLNAALNFKLYKEFDSSTLVPTTGGLLSLTIPLDASAKERAGKTAQLSELKQEAADIAKASAALNLSESLRNMKLSKERVVSLEILAAQREAQSASWLRLVAKGVATSLDILAANASQSEANAALSRERAAYFLHAVTGFTLSGVQLSELASLIAAAGGSAYGG